MKWIWAFVMVITINNQQYTTIKEAHDHYKPVRSEVKCVQLANELETVLKDSIKDNNYIQDINISCKRVKANFLKRK